MDYDLVDIPECAKKRCRWKLLYELPEGKAVRTTHSSKAVAELERHSALNYAYSNKIAIRTVVCYEADKYVLYVWR